MGKSARPALAVLFASGLLTAMAAAAGSAEAAGGPGSLDGSFGTGGSVTTNFQGDDIAHAVLAQPNGDIVAAGDSINNSTGAVDVALARYLG
jgi:hypothetical protein